MPLDAFHYLLKILFPLFVTDMLFVERQKQLAVSHSGCGVWEHGGKVVKPFVPS
jgi:hypothetical protein